MSMAHRLAEQCAWIIAGAGTGVLAGLSFVAFKVVMAVLLGGSALLPVRNIGAMALGEQSLLPGYSLALVVAVGMLVHSLLAGMYGAAFGFVVGIASVLRGSRLALLAAAAGMGLLLWIVNLYIFAPLLFPWFTENNAAVEITARIIFFGLPIGLLLLRRVSPDSIPTSIAGGEAPVTQRRLKSKPASVPSR